MFSNVNHVLQGLIYAEKMGMYPVAGMENYSTEYSRIRDHSQKENYKIFATFRDQKSLLVSKEMNLLPLDITDFEKVSEPLIRIL